MLKLIATVPTAGLPLGAFAAIPASFAAVPSVPSGGFAAELEQALFQLAEIFLWPVTLAVILALAYALVSVGGAAADWNHRRRSPSGHSRLLSADPDAPVEALELAILKDLEGLRLCSRLSPMLGLIATMIPLGPALVGVAGGESTDAVAALAPAFATVILALVAASISFAVHTLRRRWLLEELHALVSQQGRVS